MNPKRFPRIALALFPVLVSCGDDGSMESTGAAPVGRPVTTFTLEEGTPGKTSRLTGVARPYREADVGFAVAGRLEFVLDDGNEVFGALTDENGQLVRDADGQPVNEGDILAVLDPTRYEQVLDQIDLEIESAKLGLESSRIELEGVAKQDLVGAEAQLEAAELAVEVARDDVDTARSAFELAETNFERARDLLRQNVGTQADFDRTKNEYETAQARLASAGTSVEAQQRALDAQSAALERARGTIALKESQIVTQQAQIAELGARREQALKDLEDCVLRAPFSGRVTAIHVGRGALVSAGQAVVTLTLIDPIKVSVSVSAANDRRIQVGSRGRVYIDDLPEAVLTGDHLLGVVREKSEVADEATRTFRVDLMVRNVRKAMGQSAADIRSAEKLMPVLERFSFEGGALFVYPACLTEDGKHVLRIPGVSLASGEIMPEGMVVPEKVPVDLGSGYFNVIRWPFREIVGGDLERGDMLIVDPQPENEDGVMMGQPGWAIRPGELLPVEIDLGTAPSGFWVPIQAISERNGRTTVFTIEGGSAREIEVVASDAFESLRRIESDALASGLELISDGAHFLTDGDPVRVVGEAGAR